MSRKFKAEADRIVMTALDGTVDEANEALRKAIRSASGPRSGYRLDARTIVLALFVIGVLFIGVDLLDSRLIAL